MHRSDIPLLAARLFVRYHEDFKYRATVDAAVDVPNAMLYESAQGFAIVPDSAEYFALKCLICQLFTARGTYRTVVN